MAEVFAAMVRKSSNIGGLTGLKLNEDVSYNLLQFTDDTILLGDGSWKNLWAIKSMLRGFELVSRLKVNMRKINLYGVDIEESYIQAASQFYCAKWEYFLLSS